jgi:hypothetical protein
MRDGNGIIIDLDEKRAEWKANRRSPSLYLTKTEAEAFTDDIGELVARFTDGTEVRRHAYLLDSTRGGQAKIACNRIITGNPAKYKAWIEGAQDGYYPEWTYYPDHDLDEMVARQGLIIKPLTPKAIH